jgi:UDP-4-amino-4-deoxy-L-arabinose formyltransferase / UDP-glucuronic acid dehydrogenase (UDP-4-keto-hexauronic acid decarboxylating)
VTRPVCVALAYGHFGCAGVAALLRAGAYLPLVLSHGDHGDDNRWWPSVERLCHRHGIPVLLDCTLTPGAAAYARLRDLAPDYLFSFYYKNLIGAEALKLSARGAYNLHGSLLPAYRGRAPINWQLVHGASRSGLTLHEMVVRADAGRIIGQTAVAVAPDQDAYGLTQQLLAVAPAFLDQALGAIFAGRARPRAQDLSQGEVFPGRRPEDGRIDWRQSARQVHNLVRAVAPPWPGAFTFHGAERLSVNATRVEREDGALAPPGTVLSDRTISCGAGSVRPEALFNAFAQPQQLAPGTRLSTTNGAS